MISYTMAWAENFLIKISYNKIKSNLVCCLLFNNKFIKQNQNLFILTQMILTGAYFSLCSFIKPRVLLLNLLKYTSL